MVVADPYHVILMDVSGPCYGILMAVPYYEILVVTAALSSEEILNVLVLTLDGHQRTVIWQSEIHLKLIFLSSEDPYYVIPMDVSDPY